MKTRAWTALGKKTSFIFFEVGDTNFDWDMFDNTVKFDRSTGIMDISGNEVFENDLISATIPGLGGGNVSNMLVSFETGCFGIKCSEFIPLFKLSNIKVSSHNHYEN